MGKRRSMGRSQPCLYAVARSNRRESTRLSGERDGAGGPDRGTGDEKVRAAAEDITTLKERLNQMQAELDRLARRSEKE